MMNSQSMMKQLQTPKNVAMYRTPKDLDNALQKARQESKELAMELMQMRKANSFDHIHLTRHINY